MEIMKRVVLFLLFVSQGIFIARSQNVIKLQGDRQVEGAVLWERSKKDTVFYRVASSDSDSLLLFIPRRAVRYILDEENRPIMYRGRDKGWQPWRGKGFHEEPRQQMLYGVSGSWILDGWSADASFMRVLNRNSRIAVGGFVRYMFTQPVPLPVKTSYDHHAVVFGPQVEFRGYSRRLKSFFYIDFGVGGAYHRFDWGNNMYNDEMVSSFENQGMNSDNIAWLRGHYPADRWAYAFNYKIGVYVRLARGLYADAGFVGVGHIFSRIPQKYDSSDQYPFGLSVGLRFGRESK